MANDPEPRPAVPLIDYGRPRARQRRDRIVATVAIASTTVLLLHAFLKPRLQELLRWRLPFLRAQAACLNFARPPHTPAYEEDPATIARLTGGQLNGPDFTTESDDKGHIDWYASRPHLLDKMWDAPGGFNLMAQGFNDDELVFSHLRCVPGGQPRLVCVRLNNFFTLRQGGPNPSSYAISQGSLDWIVIRPATWNSPPTTFHHDTWHDLSGTFTSAMAFPLHIDFGQTDPADPSHFTIDYTCPTTAGRIDGWLLPNDTLNFAITHGPPRPITAPAATSPHTAAEPRKTPQSLTK